MSVYSEINGEIRVVSEVGKDIINRALKDWFEDLDGYHLFWRDEEPMRLTFEGMYNNLSRYIEDLVRALCAVKELDFVSIRIECLDGETSIYNIEMSTDGSVVLHVYTYEYKEDAHGNFVGFDDLDTISSETVTLYKPQTLVLMSGASGSGKSTRAKEINEKGFNGAAMIYSTDDYFYRRGHGEELIYEWNSALLTVYHAENIKRTRVALTQGLSVIVDNTNLRQEHVIPYVEMARSRGINIHVEECEGEHENTHGLSPEKVKQQKALMQDISPDKVLALVL